MGISSNKLTGLVTVAFLLVLANAGNAFATGSWTTNNKQRPLSTAPQEEVKQFKGIVVKRDPDSFTMSETTGGPTKRLARKAQSTADNANNRINGLGDFDPIKTITVYFKTGSDALTPEAKTEIDNAAAWVKTQDRRGWVMAVIGYADTPGNSARNIDLSERRANAVIYYIVTKYKMSLNSLVQPCGYGELEPVGENTTKAGRAK